MSTAIEIIAAHTPSLSDTSEAAIERRVLDPAYDAADYAVRLCSCGKRLDGFYDYQDHLIREITESQEASAAWTV